MKDAKPCPFCGKTPKVVFMKMSACWYVVCETSACPVRHHPIPKISWNARTEEKEMNR
jgi:hypothetical protein